MSDTTYYPNSYNVFENDYEKTLDLLKSELIEKRGGYLLVRNTGGLRYLDYVNNVGVANTQRIDFGENLLDFNKIITADPVATAIIPLGKDGLTIRTEEYDSIMIYDKVAVGMFGFIVDTVSFSDISDARKLKYEAEKYLSTVVFAKTTINVDAFDCGLINVDIMRIKLGDSLRCISKPHDLDEFLIVSKKVRYLDDPIKDKITLGLPTLTGSEIAAKEKSTAAKLLKKAEKISTSAENTAIYNLLGV